MALIRASLPDTANNGDAGHTADHNAIVTGLTKAAYANLDSDTWLNVNEFAGATDDLKLTAAIAAEAAIRTATGSIGNLYLCGGKTWTFLTPRTITWSGFKLTGPPGPTADETRGSPSPYDGGVRVRTDCGGTPWITFADDTNTSGSGTYSHYIGNLNFEAVGSGEQWGATSATMRTSVFENLSFTEYEHVMGRPGASWSATAMQTQGWWYVNNARGPSFVLGGSDNIWWSEGMLIDSPSAYMGSWADSASNNGEEFHIHFDHMEKSIVGPMYMTLRERLGGILISGNNGTDGQLVLTGLRVEGQNNGTPAYGCLLRQMGGGTVIRDSWFAYGMSNPAAGPLGNATYNKGIIECYGGKMLLDGNWYARNVTPAVAETVPFIYNNGGEVRACNIMRSNSDGAATWVGRPRVMHVSGTTTVDGFNTSTGLPSGFVQSGTLVNAAGTTI